ncbi:hypothetical protein SD37_11475 [Amycolatopsis orientalis]|uniref:Uncharacterized protein n=1 Tax=Amycolatopsis orientalis TaxID=31958 RepID=A0A193BVE8_AMYOR|nr:hypothetical protein [Amycolatopsis orientalis]ANN16197.1 hypothetical protein SD37_11475 [Amycolatopsis orientalis]
MAGSSTPSQRRLAGQIAANTRWAKEPDRKAATAPARKAAADRWLREADPDGTLSPAEAARRADSLKTAYFQRLALASAKSRARKKSA